MSDKDFVMGNDFGEVTQIFCPMCGDEANLVFREQGDKNLVFWVECPNDHYFSKFKVETRMRVKRGAD